MGSIDLIFLNMSFSFIGSRFFLKPDRHDSKALIYTSRCARDFRPELRRRLKFIAPGLQTRDNNGGLPDDSDSGSVGNNAASSGPQPKKPRQDF